MFSLFFTTPADQRLKHGRRATRESPSRSQALLTWGLLAVWLLLMTFGVVSYLNPTWLQELSHPGREVEAVESKKFGDDLLHQGKYALAIVHYRKSLEILPNQPAVSLHMAIAYRDWGDFASGARILTDLLEKESSPGLRAAILYNLGELREKQGRREEALHYYQQASRCDVGDDRIHGRLASLYADLGQYEQARAASQRALEILQDPSLEYKSMLRRSLDMYKEYPARLPIIEEQLARDLTTDELARYDLQIIRQVQQTSPEIAALHNHLGLLCARLGDITGAISHFEKSLRIQPDNTNTKQRLQQLRQLQHRQP